MSISEITDDNRDEVQRSSINLHHVHIFASDIDASLTFYAKWFGARVIWDDIFAGARNVFVQIGGGRLHFYDQPPQGNGINTFHHLGIQVDDLDALYLRMKEGGFLLHQPVKRFKEGAYLMVKAPDDVLLELFETPPPERKKKYGSYFY